jgi:hypothetical protein
MMQSCGRLRLIREWPAVFALRASDVEWAGRSIIVTIADVGGAARNKRGIQPALRMILGKMVEFRDDRPVKCSVQGFR